MPKKQRQKIVTDRVKLELDQLQTHLAHSAKSHLKQALLQITEGHEDAPELILSFDCVSFEEAEAVRSWFHMNEVAFFGYSTKTHHGRVDVSGYVDGSVWKDV